MNARHLAALIVVAGLTLAASHPALAQFSQQGQKLVAPGGFLQGGAVALSADGNTALVGEINGVWVWTRSGGAWTQQGTKLVGSDAAGYAAQGSSVSLSADGNTALVGGQQDNQGAGAAWVWTRNGGVWTQQGPKLVGSAAAGLAAQGESVSLSADGNIALVGGFRDNNRVGAAWVWTRNGGVWTQQGSKLVGSDAAGNAGQGASVALSADGTTAIVGGPYDNGHAGAAWVWTRSEGVWTQQQPKLVGSNASSNSFQGEFVSLSADGNTAIVGDHVLGPCVWTRSGGVWTQQGPSLGTPNWGVSLSADGHTAIVGDWGDEQVGAASVWLQRGGVWTRWGHKLVGSNAVGTFQSMSVALSADGTSAIIGSSWDDIYKGAVWIFAASVPHNFDRDRKSDRTVFRPSSGVWYSALSGGGAAATLWGAADDVDVAGDYDGDRATDIAVWRPSEGAWYILYSSDSSTHSMTWGTAGDIPLAGDMDGDGKADLVIWRPSTGTWFIKQSTGPVTVVQWGTNGDQPLLGDFDGDGTMDATVFRPSSGVWYSALSGGGSLAVAWGAPGDVPVVGDFDGDGTADLTIWRPGSSSTWWVMKSTGGVIVVDWGVNDDIPVSGDWDGDGRSDFTVWRPSDGVWYTQFAVGGGAVVEWGISGDKPAGRRPGP